MKAGTRSRSAASAKGYNCSIPCAFPLRAFARSRFAGPQRKASKAFSLPNGVLPWPAVPRLRSTVQNAPFSPTETG